MIRGPDWRDGDRDGGEGHVGTVIQLIDNHTVRVLWDMGQESTCNTGADGKFDLRVFDTAQIGETVYFTYDYDDDDILLTMNINDDDEK